MGLFSWLFGPDNSHKKVQAREETKRREIEKQQQLQKQAHEKALKQQQYRHEQAKIRYEQQVKRQQQLDRQAHEKYLKEQQFKNEEHRLKIKHQRELQIAQMNNKYKQEQLKRQRELEERRNQWKKENRDIQIKQRDEAVKEYQNKLSTMKQSASENSEKLKKLNEEYQKVKHSTERNQKYLEKFDNKKATKLNSLATKIDLFKKQKKFENLNKRIDDAIQLASLPDTQVVKFLCLTQGLVNATMASQVHITKLNSNVSTFNELFKRSNSSKLKISYYFDQNRTLKRFSPIFRKDLDMKYMEELICVNDEEWNELKEEVLKCLKERHEEKEVEIEYMSSGSESNNNSNSDNNSGSDSDSNSNSDSNSDDSDNDTKKNKNKKKIRKQDLSKISFKENRILKQHCKESEKTWKKHQIEMENVTKTYLNEVSPLFSNFFVSLYDTMIMSQKILSIDLIKNNEQQKAIKLMEKVKNDDNNQYSSIDINKNTVEIEEIKDDDSDNDNNNNSPDEDDEEEENINSETNGKFSDDENEEKEEIIYETFNDQEDIVKVEETMNDLQLQVELKKEKSVREAHLLKEAAVLQINVYSQMKNKFDKNHSTRAGVSLAKGVEESCMNIICCQGQIRQAYVLANYLVSLKPPSFDNDESEKLWDAVTDGIVNIYKSILEVTKISSKFFGFFLRFNQSFRTFLIANQQESSLLVSTKDLQKDIKDFNSFYKKLNKKTNLLGTTALKVIQSCLEKTAGASVISKAMDDRKRIMKEYLDAKKIYDDKASELEEERQNKIKLWSQDCAKRDSLQFQIEQLNCKNEWNKDIIKQLENNISKLKNMVIKA